MKGCDLLPFDRLSCRIAHRLLSSTTTAVDSFNLTKEGCSFPPTQGISLKNTTRQNRGKKNQSNPTDTSFATTKRLTNDEDDHDQPTNNDDKHDVTTEPIWNKTRLFLLSFTPNRKYSARNDRKGTKNTRTTT